MMSSILEELSTLLNRYGATLPTIVLMLLNPRETHKFTQDLLQSSNTIFEAFASHPSSSVAIQEFAAKWMSKKCREELGVLTDIDSGWHFNATHTTPDQLDEVQLEETAQRMQENAPYLSAFLDVLLMGNKGGKDTGASENDLDDEDEDREPESQPAVMTGTPVKRGRSQKRSVVRAIVRISLVPDRAVVF